VRSPAVTRSFEPRGSIRESRDEVLFGELIRSMSRLDFVAVDFRATSGARLVRFKAPSADPLAFVWIGLDLWAGSGAVTAKIEGSRASVRLDAELDLDLVEPEMLLEVWRTGAAEVMNSPSFGRVKLQHRVSTVLARATSQLNTDDYILRGANGSSALTDLLAERIGELRTALEPFLSSRP